ncbi:MAG TPA: hypothetical protein VEW28_05730 [Candidatus Kapabacteria bacterium]|nr:hypothetical protein [Candidatus Kapabacteria bacterium]
MTRSSTKSLTNYAIIATVVTLIMMFGTKHILAQHLDVYTKPLPNKMVYLSWPPDTAAGPYRYNIYRKLVSDPNFPSTPMNSAPIAPATNCVTFKTYIAMGSGDWNLLANAFADSVTHVPLSNVCDIANFAFNSKNWNRALVFARAKKQVGIVMGYAFEDNSVINGTAYRYRIRRVDGGGNELPSTGADEASITAGTPAAVPAATSMRIVIGDAKLQILWAKPADEHFRAFNVYRTSGGPYRRVNETDISTDMFVDLDSNTVVPSPSNGFTDYERWDSAGHVQPRAVTGVPGTFSGPANGTSYSYKTTLKDILGNESAFSSVVTGTPVDKTPPAIPTDLVVTPSEPNSTIEIRWPKKTKDVLGHDENMSGYRVYRYGSGENPADPNTPVGGLIAQPIDSTIFLSVTDNSNPLRDPCKDSTHWYRVVAIDAAGNQSQRSVAVNGVLRDTTKPADVKGTKAKGFDDYIKVEWKPNGDCNIEQYLIYRALCDYGDWISCDTVRDAKGVPTNNLQGGSDKKKGPKSPKDCGGPFVLVGTLSHIDAKSRASSNGGLAYFDDHTVPSGSPICYAYLVKAQDMSQNISGTFPTPTRPPEIVVCERLRDKTPPPPGIIAGLFSRDSAIRIDFIGQPIQDIAAYHIYRSDSAAGTYHWVGGMTVEPPPMKGSILTHPYHPPPTVGCDSVPLVSNPYMSAGTFIDKKVERHKIYWYKVLGIDQSGNESPIDSAVAMSTFTFARNRETPPALTSIASMEGPCTLKLTWTPMYDSTAMTGFVVFRSDAMNGPYLQLENIVKDNTFLDNSVARGTTYWYRIAMLKVDGLLTRLSDPKNAVHP